MRARGQISHKALASRFECLHATWKSANGAPQRADKARPVVQNQWLHNTVADRRKSYLLGGLESITPQS